MSMSQEEAVMQKVLASFDPDAFMLAEYEEALETERTLLPVGDVKIETIRDFEIIKPRLYTDATTKEQIWLRPTLRLQMVIKDQGLLERINARGDEYIFRYQFNMDINEQQRLDFGPNRNITLGKLREALGQNVPGIGWSFLQLKNCQPFGVNITHKKSKDGENTFEDVSKWFAWTDAAEAA